MADYTVDQLFAKLERADAAGDTEAAKVIADEIRRVQGAPRPSANDSAFAGMITGRKPKPAGVLDMAKRELGLGARAAIRGAYDLTSMFGADLINAAESKIRGVPVRSQSENADWLADKLGLPEPETTTERIGGDITSALVGGGGLMSGGRMVANNAAPGLVREAGKFLSAAPGAQVAANTASSAAGSTTREAGGGTGAQVAASLIGGLSPAAIRGGSAMAVRGAARGGEAGRKRLEESIEQFDRAGETPTLGQSGVNARTQYAEAALRNAPGGAGVVRQRLEAQAQNMGQRVDELAGDLSPASGAERGGRAVERGITGPSGFMQEFRKKSGELYDQVERLLPQNTPVAAQSTQRVLAELTTPIAGAANTSTVLTNGKVASIAKAFSDDLQAGGGQLSYDAIKRLRTQIGEAIGDSALSPDTPTRQLRALYGAMTEDMTQAALATNNPQVINAAKRANAYYKAGMGRVDEIERVIDRSGGPEAIYRALFAGSREGGTTLRRVMQSLDGQGQRDLAAVTLRRMGRANPGAQDELGEVFSPETFLTNWNRMAPEAKRALFDRFGPTFRGDLDAIAGATARMRDAAQILPNPSGTAPLMAQVTAYGAIAGSIMSGNAPAAGMVVGGMAMSNVLAKAFTSPATVRWLAKQTKLPPQALQGQLPALAQIGKTDPAAAELHAALTRAGQ